MLKAFAWTFNLSFGIIIASGVAAIILAVIMRLRGKSLNSWIEDQSRPQSGWWGHGYIPIRLLVHPEIPDHYFDAINKCAILINQWAGLYLFSAPIRWKTIVGDVAIDQIPERACAIILSWSIPQRGTCRHRFDDQDGYIRACLVTIPSCAPASKLHPILVHELLHVLGVGENDFSSSISNPARLLTTADLRQLRAAYSVDALAPTQPIFFKN